jgi:signal transduction histidine kinase
MTEAFLEQLFLSKKVSKTDFERVCGIVEEIELSAGDVLFDEGDPGGKAYIIQEGKLEVVKTSGERDVLLAVRGPGEVIGEMSLLEQAPRMATVRARTNSNLIALNQEQFNQLLGSSPSVARTLLVTVIQRWRGTEAMLRQSEKMAQLGMLTAGVAHDLNNPAAAIRSGVTQLHTWLKRFNSAQEAVRSLDLNDDKLQLVEQLRELADRESAPTLAMNALDRSDREEHLAAWLDERGFGEPWELAPELVEMGLTDDVLGQLDAQFSVQQLRALVPWAGASYTVNRILAEIKEGADRIASIVKALKSYVYLDQAPVQSVDIEKGLEDTLLILRNKIKKGISIQREYAPDLPRIHAYGSELNQVWTNIMDNAIDALEGEGTITIRTSFDAEGITVEIEDDGTGIPNEVQKRIFDPFFTTKPPGQGTGLGLDIAYNIIVHHHGGEIDVNSQPGSTRFVVWLPMKQEANENARSSAGSEERSPD